MYNQGTIPGIFYTEVWNNNISDGIIRRGLERIQLITNEMVPRIKENYYYILDRGIVLSYRGGNLVELKQEITNSGYNRVDLYLEDSTHIKVSVHRLVAMAFVPNIDPLTKTQVNHIDGNKLNNDFTNLEWTTASENVQHALTTGLLSYETLLDRGQVIFIANCLLDEENNSDSDIFHKFRKAYPFHNITTEQLKKQIQHIHSKDVHKDILRQYKFPQRIKHGILTKNQVYFIANLLMDPFISYEYIADAFLYEYPDIEYTHIQAKDAVRNICSYHAYSRYTKRIFNFPYRQEARQLTDNQVFFIADLLIAKENYTKNEVTSIFNTTYPNCQITVNQVTNIKIKRSKRYQELLINYDFINKIKKITTIPT